MSLSTNYLQNSDLQMPHIRVYLVIFFFLQKCTARYKIVGISHKNGYTNQIYYIIYMNQEYLNYKRFSFIIFFLKTITNIIYRKPFYSPLRTFCSNICKHIIDENIAFVCGSYQFPFRTSFPFVLSGLVVNIIFSYSK